MLRLTHRIVLAIVLTLTLGCVAAGNRPPQLVQWVEAAYPPAAKAQGIEGYVVVRYRVSAEGRVSDAQVIEAQPAGVFDQAALTTVSGWRYEPAIIDGAPVAVEQTSRVTFAVGDGKAYEGY